MSSAVPEERTAYGPGPSCRHDSMIAECQREGRSSGCDPPAFQSRWASTGTQKPLVDFEMMTWPEVKKAIHEQGKTTALVYNGGTEQRGPQNVNGGHTLMGHATVVAIAEKLGNAVAAPVMPFSVNNANADLPGTIGLTSPLFAAINEQVAEQMIKNGFKNIVLMGDHGGGQKELGEVAKTA